MTCDGCGLKDSESDRRGAVRTAGWPGPALVLPAVRTAGSPDLDVRMTRSLRHQPPVILAKATSLHLLNFGCPVVLLFLLSWCSFVLLFCCPAVLFFCCSVIPLFCCSVVLLFRCPVVLLFCCSLSRCPDILLYCCSAVLLFCCPVSVVLMFCSSFLR